MMSGLDKVDDRPGHRLVLVSRSQARPFYLESLRTDVDPAHNPAATTPNVTGPNSDSFRIVRKDRLPENFRCPFLLQQHSVPDGNERQD